MTTRAKASTKVGGTKVAPARPATGKGQRVGYIRVSSVDQNTARQLDGINLDKVFTDECSGGSVERPKLQACLGHLREGDSLHVHSIDRLARNLTDLRDIVKTLTDKGVIVRFEKEDLTFSGVANPMNELMLNMMGAFSEFERALIRERQREGIEKAKERGVCKGRKHSLEPEQVAQIKMRAEQGEPKAALAREFGISRETVYQYLRLPMPDISSGRADMQHRRALERRGQKRLTD